jgi:hypothetical protein
MALHPESAPAAPLASDGDLRVRLRWLLRLRWLVVPAFVAVVLASDLLVGRHNPWGSLLVGAGLLALNAAYAAVLSAPSPAAPCSPGRGSRPGW